ncbi:hypothetical protein ADUPG1_009491 [Aduncisulcus paluster]|uniref:Uncharacterized protein n=1 Tax=Aduncisulcus paluster TaxID=2918883 RepID=A0ABQ5KVR3_9EUKA|nr:hypothetical protein ADUPG1_009491 [Aduncisulcus paluster]
MQYAISLSDITGEDEQVAQYMKELACGDEFVLYDGKEDQTSSIPYSLPSPPPPPPPSPPPIMTPSLDMLDSYSSLSSALFNAYSWTCPSAYFSDSVLSWFDIIRHNYQSQMERSMGREFIPTLPDVGDVRGWLAIFTPWLSEGSKSKNHSKISGAYPHGTRSSKKSLSQGSRVSYRQFDGFSQSSKEEEMRMADDDMPIIGKRRTMRDQQVSLPTAEVMAGACQTSLEFGLCILSNEMRKTMINDIGIDVFEGIFHEERGGKWLSETLSSAEPGFSSRDHISSRRTVSDKRNVEKEEEEDASDPLLPFSRRSINIFSTPRRKSLCEQVRERIEEVISIHKDHDLQFEDYDEDNEDASPESDTGIPPMEYHSYRRNTESDDGVIRSLTQKMPQPPPPSSLPPSLSARSYASDSSSSTSSSTTSTGFIPSLPHIPTSCSLPSLSTLSSPSPITSLSSLSFVLDDSIPSMSEARFSSEILQWAISILTGLSFPMSEDAQAAAHKLAQTLCVERRSICDIEEREKLYMAFRDGHGARLRDDQSGSMHEEEEGDDNDDDYSLSGLQKYVIQLNTLILILKKLGFCGEDLCYHFK